MKHKVLSVADVAALLNISEVAVRGRVYLNQIPYHRWGRKIIFSAAELDQFIERLPGLSVKQAAAKVEGDAA
jgi:excisionase family DNA binding protein